MQHVVHVLVISGSMGAGKTTVLGEASDLLTAAKLAHAAINLDALSIGHAPAGWPPDLWATNLASVWSNYAALGIDRVLISEAIDERSKIDRIGDAIPGARVVVCRLRASIPTLQQRVRLREPGQSQEQLAARAAWLDGVLDRAAIEDFSIDNDDRSVTEVARELLTKAGWIHR